jgi:hypothetical protein
MPNGGLPARLGRLKIVANKEQSSEVFGNLL